MPASLSYWVLVTTRNRHENLHRTLISLWNQTIQPEEVVVFDDGSQPPVTNEKPDREILLRREDEGYDIRRVVRNWNECFDRAVREGIAERCDYAMISADDCEYPPNYAEALMLWMGRNNMSVASGSRGLKVSWDGWKAPEGAGRMVSTGFLKDIGFHLPERAGYEPWIFLEAMRRGRKVGAYNDLHYEHLEQFGKGHGFVEWGHMAHTLGYDPFFFVGRCFKNLVTGDVPRQAVVKMFLVYLKDFLWKPSNPFYQNFGQEFQHFVRSTQRKRLTTLLHIP